MIMVLCILTSLLVFFFLLMPFFVGSGGPLSPHSSLGSPESLEFMRKRLLDNYLKCEELFMNQQLTKREWEQRQIFLTNRYVDLTRRLDALSFQKKGPLQ